MTTDFNFNDYTFNVRSNKAHQDSNCSNCIGKYDSDLCYALRDVKYGAMCTSGQKGYFTKKDPKPVEHPYVNSKYMLVKNPQDNLLNNCADCVASNDSTLCCRLEENHLEDCAGGLAGFYEPAPVKSQEEPKKVIPIVPVDIQEQTPGTKYDDDKLQYSLIPPYALQAVARNLTIGLKKYKERDNWKKVPDAKRRYQDALMRHFEAIRRGEEYDPDSSVDDMPHMAAVAVNALFLLEFMLNPEFKEDKDTS